MPATATRDDVLDGIKGVLVLVMVLYHWLNYFVGLEWGGYRYLRFLTPSFIFITGFLVSHVYLARYASRPETLRSRLVQRGAKLLLLFAALNLADTAVAMRSVSPVVLAAQWPMARIAGVLTTGEGAAFSILLPIAYFLLIAPFVVAAAATVRFGLEWLGAVAVAGAIAMTLGGVENAVVEFLAIALLGLAFGAGRLFQLDALSRHPAAVVLAYGAYCAAIALLNVPYWLQVVGVCVSLALLHLGVSRWREPAAIKSHVVRLGQYSLFAYVAQIAILQAVKRVAAFEAAPAVAFAVALVLLSAVVEIAARLRVRSTRLDLAYRTVFA